MLNDEVSRKYIQSLKRYVVAVGGRRATLTSAGQALDVFSNKVSAGGRVTVDGLGTHWLAIVLPFVLSALVIGRRGEGVAGLSDVYEQLGPTVECKRTDMTDLRQVSERAEEWMRHAYRRKRLLSFCGLLGLPEPSLVFL